MVYENIAGCYCEICGKFIKEAVVSSPSKDRQIKVVLDLCEECEGEFYRYNALAQFYDYARILIYKSFVGRSDKDRLKEYMRSQHLIFDPFLEDKIRKRESFEKILWEFREKFRLLSRSTEEVVISINRYNKAEHGVSLGLPTKGNPAKRFEVFIHRKMKRHLTRVAKGLSKK